MSSGPVCRTQHPNRKPHSQRSDGDRCRLKSRSGGSGTHTTTTARWCSSLPDDIDCSAASAARSEKRSEAPTPDSDAKRLRLVAGATAGRPPSTPTAPSGLNPTSPPPVSLAILRPCGRPHRPSPRQADHVGRIPPAQGRRPDGQAPGHHREAGASQPVCPNNQPAMSTLPLPLLPPSPTRRPRSALPRRRRWLRSVHCAWPRSSRATSIAWFWTRSSRPATIR